MATLHISRHYLGDVAIFTPRIPVSQLSTEREFAPRVCGASSEEACWAAINRGDLHQAMWLKGEYSGYYFFVYELEGEFASSQAADANMTGEVVCFSNCTGKLVKAIYVSGRKLYKSNYTPDSATIGEAVGAYADWQKADILRVEEIINSTEWEEA